MKQKFKFLTPVDPRMIDFSIACDNQEFMYSRLWTKMEHCYSTARVELLSASRPGHDFA